MFDSFNYICEEKTNYSKIDISLNEADYYLPNETFFNMENIEYNTIPVKNSFNKDYSFLKKKVGRKTKSDNEKGKRIHTKFDDDNIHRKLNVHFIQFLTDFVNEILNVFNIDEKFLKIDYKEISKINKNIFNNLKSLTIGDILRQNISSKYRKKYTEDKEHNNKLYLEIIKYKELKNILSDTYINVFRNYYFNNKKEINIYNNKIIKLSNKIKTFESLLDKNKDDQSYISKIQQFVGETYLSKKLFNTF